MHIIEQSKITKKNNNYPSVDENKEEVFRSANLLASTICKSRRATSHLPLTSHLSFPSRKKRGDTTSGFLTAAKCYTFSQFSSKYISSVTVSSGLSSHVRTRTRVVLQVLPKQMSYMFQCGILNVFFLNLTQDRPLPETACCALLMLPRLDQCINATFKTFKYTRGFP